MYVCTYMHVPVYMVGICAFMPVLTYVVHICVCVSACVSVSVWRPEDNPGCCSLLGTIHPAFLREFLTRTWALVIMLGQLARSPRDPFVSNSSVPRLQVWANNA